MPQNDGTVLMEGVRLVFRNFEGRETKFNQLGSRNFGVVIDDETAKVLTADGWNVKQFKEREDAEEGETAEYWLPVKIKYGVGSPPNVSIITSRGRTRLGENEIEMLDGAEITNVDLIVRPYTWSNARGESGISAYVKTMVVTIEEDELERKYAEVPVQ
jgi:hypothetical protein